MTSPPDQPADDIADQLRLPQFPRAAGYDAGWMLDNVMGPNALWLAESLSEVLPLSPGMRVLDLGCGKALTSIFLVKEFGVRVWAGELWVHPSENWKRINEAGVEADVVPMKVEAHTLPFAAEFFDAIVSIDAYHYFGTDDLYLSYLAHFLAPGGRLGVVSPRSKTSHLPTSSPIGSPISSASIRRPGGVASGSGPARSTSKWPTPCPTAGNCGSAGMKPASKQRPLRPRRASNGRLARARCCAPTRDEP